MSVSSAKYSDLIIGASKLLATLLTVPLVDRLGRRPLLLSGIVIMAFALLLLTIGFSTCSAGVACSMSPEWSHVVVVALVAYVTGDQGM